MLVKMAFQDPSLLLHDNEISSRKDTTMLVSFRGSLPKFNFLIFFLKSFCANPNKHDLLDIGELFSKVKFEWNWQCGKSVSTKDIKDTVIIRQLGKKKSKQNLLISKRNLLNYSYMGYEPHFPLKDEDVFFSSNILILMFTKNKIVLKNLLYCILCD